MALPFNALADTKGAFPPLPVRQQEADGSWSLAFDKLAHVSLPMQVVPMYAGHKISMKIWVDKHFKEQQNIFGSGSHAFMLSVTNGTLNAKMFLWNYYYAGKGVVIASSITKLIPGQWNDVEIVFDQKNFAINLNKTPGKPVRVSGFHMRPKSGIIGGGESRKGYFTGKIKDLSIEVL